MKKLIFQTILSKLVKAQNKETNLNSIIMPLKLLVLAGLLVTNIFVNSPDAGNIQYQIAFWGLPLWIAADIIRFVLFKGPFQLSIFLKNIICLSDNDFLGAMNYTEKNINLLKKVKDPAFENEIYLLLVEKFHSSVEESDREHTKGYCRATYPKTSFFLGWNQPIRG